MARYAYGYIDSSRAQAKLNRAYKKIVKQATVSTRELVTWGANFAKQIVPYQTGQTWSAIKTSTSATNDGAKGKIYIANIQREDSGEFSNTPSKTTQQLVSIMHTWSGAKRHFRSGDPHFMYTTRDRLNTTGKTKVKKDFKELKFN